MITKDKVTEIFCIIDEFDKNLSAELAKNLRLPSHNSDGKRYRNRKGRLSESEIMTILVCYHFGAYRNFKEYYLNWVKGVMRQDFPDAVSYNRFVELMPRVFFKMMLFMKLYAFANVREFRLSIVQWFPYATTSDDISTKYSKDWKRMKKLPWDSITDSSYTCCATIEESL